MCILQQSLKTTGFWYSEEVADDVPASKSMKLKQAQTSCFSKIFQNVFNANNLVIVYL